MVNEDGLCGIQENDKRHYISIVTGSFHVVLACNNLVPCFQKKKITEKTFPCTYLKLNMLKYSLK